MNAVEMPEGQDLVAKLIALRDALVGTSQTLRDLQFQIDQEGRKQAEDTIDTMLDRFALTPPSGNAGPAAAA
ncbi:hypothetical protein LJR289_003686 [Pseudoduganella sp. LjRoot289]|uniref:hypothetical protein n=1 Tax=Pseudoduganella sp. LjRoot289 TaxID=3342314 RepID=UPI003ECC269B